MMDVSWNGYGIIWPRLRPESPRCIFLAFSSLALMHTFNFELNEQQFLLFNVLSSSPLILTHSPFPPPLALLFCNVFFISLILIIYPDKPNATNPIYVPPRNCCYARRHPSRKSPLQETPLLPSFPISETERYAETAI
jgi:hypothetical protein